MKEKRNNEAGHIEGRLSKNERIERQLNSLYDFRFNIVKAGQNTGLQILPVCISQSRSLL